MGRGNLHMPLSDCNVCGCTGCTACATTCRSPRRNSYWWGSSPKPRRCKCDGQCSTSALCSGCLGYPCHARAVEAAAQAARDAKDLGEDAPAPHKLAWYNRGAALLVRRKLGATRFGSVQTKYVDAARPHFRKKIAKQEKEAAAIAANLAAGLTADGRAK